MRGNAAARFCRKQAKRKSSPLLPRASFLKANFRKLIAEAFFRKNTL
jgi:hypothetical protein